MASALAATSQEALRPCGESDVADEALAKGRSVAVSRRRKRSCILAMVILVLVASGLGAAAIMKAVDKPTTTTTTTTTTLHWPPPLPTATDVDAAISLGDRVIVLGPDASYEFDGKNWTAAATMPRARAYAPAAEYRGRIYVAGGAISDANGLEIARSVDVYDNKSWTAAQRMQSRRYGHALVAYKSGLYALGGNDAEAAMLSSVEVFDGHSWQPAPAMLSPRAGHVAAVLNGKLYVFGGASDGTSVEAFDGERWAAVEGDMPSARREFAVATMGDRVLVLGGYIGNSSNTLATVDAFDGHSWHAEPPMAVPRYHLSAAVFEGKLFAIGGSSNTTVDVDAVEVFNGTRWDDAVPTQI